MEKEELLVLLKEAQSKFGHLSRELLVELAESLDVPLSQVYGVASFYSFLSTNPGGRNVIKICNCTPCLLSDSDAVLDSIKRKLGINPGETTSDGRFSLELTNCIGACDKAPAMMVNYEVYRDLTPRKISRILQKYK